MLAWGCIQIVLLSLRSYKRSCIILVNYSNISGNNLSFLGIYLLASSMPKRGWYFRGLHHAVLLRFSGIHLVSPPGWGKRRFGGLDEIQDAKRSKRNKKTAATGTQRVQTLKTSCLLRKPCRGGQRHRIFTQGEKSPTSLSKCFFAGYEHSCMVMLYYPCRDRLM